MQESKEENIWREMISNNTRLTIEEKCPIQEHAKNANRVKKWSLSSLMNKKILQSRAEDLGEFMKNLER